MTPPSAELRANELRIEAARRELLARAVPWDDLRQRRVLAGIEATLDTALDATLDATLETALEGARPRRAAPRRARVVWRALGGAVAVAAAVLLTLWLGPLGTDPAAMTVADVVEPVQAPRRPAIPFATPPTMALADGSSAELHDGARVVLDVQTPDLVRLDQRSGTVRYQVSKNPSRRFVVDAGGVEVRVIGTIFTVAYAGDTHVEIAVERGLVEVAAAGRIAQLGAGDSLTVERAPDDDVVIIDDDDHDAPTPVPGALGAARRGKSSPSPRPSEPSLDTLLTEADQARAAGDLSRAAAALQAVVSRFPKDAQAVTAYFQLGKVERLRGRHAAAAAAFAACVRRSPRGTLAEDARAESAQAWADAGRVDNAAATAAAYLDRYPQGAHAGRMQRIVEPSE